MASLNYDNAWSKANDPTFRNRLRVALTRHSQYQIQRDRHVVLDGGVEDPLASETPERYAALQDLARVVLIQVRQPDWMVSAGLYALLPWGAVNDADDESLDGRVATIFPELGATKIPE